MKSPPTLDWHAVPSHVAEGPPEVRHADGWLVCETCSDHYATIMAAAPMMVEALKKALPRLEDNARFLRDIQAHAGQVVAAFDAVEAVKAALAKAGAA
jgi:hypothetical protein